MIHDDLWHWECDLDTCLVVADELEEHGLTYLPQVIRHWAESKDMYRDLRARESVAWIQDHGLAGDEYLAAGLLLELGVNDEMPERPDDMLPTQSWFEARKRRWPAIPTP